MNEVSIAKISKQLNEDNFAMQKLYPKGVNHRGTELEWFELEGFRIYAINLDQANNILHQAKMDA